MLISEIENCFKQRCDGDWEHQGGISIETLDNPGWCVKVEYSDLEHSVDVTVEEKSIRRSDIDFITFTYDGSPETLTIVCGVSNLSEALELSLGFEAN